MKDFKGKLTRISQGDFKEPNARCQVPDPRLAGGTQRASQCARHMFTMGGSQHSHSLLPGVTASAGKLGDVISTLCPIAQFSGAHINVRLTSVNSVLAFFCSTVRLVKDSWIKKKKCLKVQKFLFYLPKRILYICHT